MSDDQEQTESEHVEATPQVAPPPDPHRRHVTTGHWIVQPPDPRLVQPTVTVATGGMF